MTEWFLGTREVQRGEGSPELVYTPLLQILCEMSIYGPLCFLLIMLRDSGFLILLFGSYFVSSQNGS
jgi:hypothetical protein